MRDTDIALRLLKTWIPPERLNLTLLRFKILMLMLLMSGKELALRF